MLNNVGILARKLYDQLRREAAAVKIEKNFRGYVARKSYLTVRSTAITLQTGLRAMKARNEFRFRKQTKAAILVQVLTSISFMVYGLFVEKIRPCSCNFVICLAIRILCDNFAGSFTSAFCIFLLQKIAEGCNCYSVWLEAKGC